VAVQPVAQRAGRSSATAVRAVTVRGRGGTLALLVEVWGAGPRQAELEERLASGIASAFARAGGSSTARLRLALEVADRWLGAVARPAEEAAALPDLGAGASILLAVGEEVLLAQVGPALAFGLAADGSVWRAPASSPWLRRGIETLADDPLWPPLGRGARLEIHWSPQAAQAQLNVLLAPSTAIGDVSPEVVTGLLAGRLELADLGASEGPLPADTPLLYLTLPEPVAGAAHRAAATGTTGTTVATAAATGPGRSEALAAGAAGWWTRAGPRLRLGLAAALRTTARVLVSLLPARSGPEAGPAGAERARLLATAAVALPLAIAALTVVTRSRAAQLGPVAPPGSVPDAAIPAPGAWSAVDDVNGRVQRLGDLEPIVGLGGKAAESRSLVVAGGAAYVLNRVSDQVERVSGTVRQTVLERGQAVGEEVVAELEDLFWLPAAGEGAAGQVVALDAAGRLWQVSDGGAARIGVSDQPVWRAVSRAAGFDGQLYVVDRSTGQVLRYERSAGGARPAFTTPGSSRLIQPADLSRAVDLAIDSAIYVLLADGAIQKYEAGAPASFALSGLDRPLSQPRALYTSPTAGRLLVADSGNGRIVVLSSEGAFQGQLLRPPSALSADPAERTGHFPDLHDVWWDESAGVLTILAGNVLYRGGYR
jgi:hypothetical protein